MEQSIETIQMNHHIELGSTPISRPSNKQLELQLKHKKYNFNKHTENRWNNSSITKRTLQKRHSEKNLYIVQNNMDICNNRLT
jgi:hypothetical protein